MKRTTIKLPEDIDARLRHEAERRGSTVSELTREAIAQYLDAPPPGRRQFGAAATGRSGQSDVSGRINKILSQEWGQ
jgi:predicted transcriptional regulator